MLPKPRAIVTEAITVIAGAVLAAVVIGQIPQLREWIKRQWDGAPR